jgi:hypothetical protein
MSYPNLYWRRSTWRRNNCHGIAGFGDPGDSLVIAAGHARPAATACSSGMKSMPRKKVSNKSLTLRKRSGNLPVQGFWALQSLGNVVVFLYRLFCGPCLSPRIFL